MNRLKLIALPRSPFAARLHIQLLEKGLDWEFEYPPAQTSASEHAAINPFARSPILLNGPDYLIESAAIAEYLEDLHPDSSLRGSTPWATARMRGFIAALDQYLFPQLFRLRALKAGDPAIPDVVAELHQVLARLERLFDSDVYICDQHLTLADCALVPACFYLDFFFNRYQLADWRLQHARLAEWWTTMLNHDSVQQVMNHLRASLPPAR
ncbi:MAG: glutathione S-transferase family protein [Xanthomonadales bacterium]|nr:glutathione S-transferase family protein [Xanthomonadales bacterium]